MLQTLTALYPKKQLPVLAKYEAGWTQISSGRFRGNKNLLPLPGVETQFAYRPARSLASVQTALSQG